MFYFKVVRVSHERRFENYVYNRERCAIIPIVSPTSPLGKALLSDEYLLLVSDALEKVNADLIYVDKRDSYKEFIADIKSWCEKVDVDRSLRDPMVIIKTSNDWELFIINQFDDDDPNEAKKILWGIVNCIGERDINKKLARFMKKRDLKMFYFNNAEYINTFLQLIEITATLVTGVPAPNHNTH